MNKSKGENATSSVCHAVIPRAVSSLPREAAQLLHQVKSAHHWLAWHLQNSLVIYGSFTCKCFTGLCLHYQTVSTEGVVLAQHCILRALPMPGALWMLSGYLLKDGLMSGWVDGCVDG